MCHQSADNGTCQKYVDNPACTLASRQCAFYSDEGTCLHEYATYSCESKHQESDGLWW
ncbi:hypothetical protein EWT52_06790 [Escherichia coli O25b:H4]|nr:hypothetical protein EWT52_06790 [Escherichia coli O25b:H4]